MSDLLIKPTVLVVDDVPANIDVLSGVLRNEYKVKVANNGEKALKLAFSENPPDLILLDIMMPGMDGYEVCRRLKENFSTRNIPVVFVTAMGEVEDEKQGFDLGAVDYITKPISPAIVLARVKTHLALYDLNRMLEGKVRERTAELNRTRLQIIQRLGRAAEYKDNVTGFHVIRMSHYCQWLGRAVGMTEDEVDLILNAAPMHDIGKIGVPDRILKKPGKLDDEEWKIMRLHPEIGANIIGEDPSELLQAARVMALTHHEKWDGSGYPRRLSGEDIPLYGRITAIADVFDALISNRPYKQAWEIDKAFAVIDEEKGKHFDPVLASKFLEIKTNIIAIMEEYKDE